MADLLLDHNVAHGVAIELRHLGHGVVSAHEWHGERATDGLYLLFAAQQGRILLTCDSMDFRLLHDAWLRWFEAFPPQPMPQHSGILIIPQPDYRRQRWLADEAARQVDAFLANGPPLVNTLYLWTPSRGWVAR